MKSFCDYLGLSNSCSMTSSVERTDLDFKISVALHATYFSNDPRTLNFAMLYKKILHSTQAGRTEY